MPRTEVKLFCTKDGRVPLLDWLEILSAKAQRKCIAKIIRLQELGHELRRPEADFLRDGIYELRVRYQHEQYRMLYFFHGREAVIVAHGFKKGERRVWDREIEIAIRCKEQCKADPEAHTAALEI